MGSPAEAPNVVGLKYVARAGLLPELTRQTYDSLYKALREVILNSVDAGASCIVVDLSGVESEGRLEITDDGAGMTLQELQQSFMSLGGSQKFSASDKFGRIGIGSLALMHYAQSVEIETTKIGTTSVTRALIAHPWALDQAERAQELGDFAAGQAWQERRSASRTDHYTKIRLNGVDEVLLRECADIGAYYRLVDRLRRILPLDWPDTGLSAQLGAIAPDLVSRIREHTGEFSAHVLVRSQWSDEAPMAKRIFGDTLSQGEEWNGHPHPILKNVTVDDGSTTRTVVIAGYLLSQVRPATDWSGVTVRVQNVAVEERSFFDLESDPGFRKYITGEVWLLGEVDRTRLINIDRASFSRESPDYRAVARAMQAELVRFKTECVQAPQRAKVAIKRRLDQQVAIAQAASRLTAAASSLAPAQPRGASAFPSSHNGSIRTLRPRGLLDDLQALGAVIVIEADDSARVRPYRLKVASDGRRALVEVQEHLVRPMVSLNGASYSLRFADGRPSDAPIIVKNRPREIVFNLAHDLFHGEMRVAALEMVMALELAYLTGSRGSEDGLYDRVLALLAAR